MTTSLRFGEEFGHHGFVYDPDSDMYHCEHCGAFEVAVQTPDGYEPCPIPFGNDFRRLFLEVTLHPRVEDSWVPTIVGAVRAGRFGRVPDFAFDNVRTLLIETSPTLVDGLEQWLSRYRIDITGGREVPGDYELVAETVRRRSEGDGRAWLETLRAKVSAAGALR